MIENKVNRGVILSPPEIEDFKIGDANLTLETINDSLVWPIPTREKQRFQNFDSYACVAESATTIIESQLTYMLGLPTFPKFIRKWLQDNGYFDASGFVNFSDRFAARHGGVIPRQGTTVKKMWNGINNFGLVPESKWPVWDTMQESEFFMDSSPELDALGIESLKYIKASYQWMYGGTEGVAAKTLPFNKYLKQSPIQIITATCDPWSYGVIPMCYDAPVHATAVLSKMTNVLPDTDSYDPFDKKLSLDYLIYQAMRGVVQIQTKNITTDMVRWAWLKREDLRRAYPAENKFVNVSDPNDTIYDWMFHYGQFEMELDILDWGDVDMNQFPEYKFIVIPASTIQKKNNWLDLIIQFIKKLLTF